MLPVIIAGAGPCGLVAALTLQQQKVPFILVEKATRAKLCADVGSGFDLAPTAMDILSRRLKLENYYNNTYAGMRLQDMSGKVIQDMDLTQLDNMKDMFVSVRRSDLQRVLLERLLSEQLGEDKNENRVLQCGVAVQSYRISACQKNGSKIVEAILSDGSTLQGSALLACDGIHSAIRQCMMQNKKVEDPLHFCDIICYWGKCDIQQSKKLHQAVTQTQTQKEGNSFLWSLGSHAFPGTFMGAPVDGTFIWAFCIKPESLLSTNNRNSSPEQPTDDLTRRGGQVLNDETKQQLLAIFQGRDELLQLIVQETPASDITQVGLFDRSNLDLSYTDDSKLVALLGDAAHPQTPFMGQGVNMAITDAYVCAKYLAASIAAPANVRQEQDHDAGTASTGTDSIVSSALACYDTEERRSSVNKVIHAARSYADISVSESRIMCWLFRTILTWIPFSWILADITKGDQSNHDFVAIMDQSLPSPPPP